MDMVVVGRWRIILTMHWDSRLYLERAFELEFPSGLSC